MDKIEERIMEMMTNRGLLDGVDESIIGEIREEVNRIVNNAK